MFINMFLGINRTFSCISYSNRMFYAKKVHIKYEKRKNEAITLSIKGLKGLWKAA